MAGRSKSVLDVREMLRRLRAGDTDRRIARELKVSRRTVKKYRERAAEAGWLTQEQLVGPEVLEEVLRQVEEERQLSELRTYNARLKRPADSP